MFSLRMPFSVVMFLYRLHLSPLSKLIWGLNRFLYHVDLDFRANLAGGFVLIHGLGTVIGRGVVSKGILIVYQHCTLGGNQGRIRVDENGKKCGFPLLENNVTLYAGASVFGPVIVSEGTKIKAGQIVSQSL